MSPNWHQRAQTLRPAARALFDEYTELKTTWIDLS